MTSIASGKRAACPDCVPFGSVFAVFIHPAQSARLLTKCRCAEAGTNTTCI